ncbi:MAG: hypothetical protein ACOYMA_00040 [Bacteroidia bacterium]
MKHLEFVITALADVADECDKRSLVKEADELSDIIGFLAKFAEINKEAYIQTIKSNGKTKYVVKSEKNPDWKGGTYSSKSAAEKRLAEVEMFKHIKKRRDTKKKSK